MSRPPLDVPRLRRVPRQARSRERLARMLDAAEELLVAEGPGALTTTRVAVRRGRLRRLAVPVPARQGGDRRGARRPLPRGVRGADGGARRGGLRRPPSAGPTRSAGCSTPSRSATAIAPATARSGSGARLTPGLRAADRDNKAALAGGLERVLRTLGLRRRRADLETAALAGVLIADALLQEAFRSDSRGEAALIGEAKRVLRLYLADVLARA